MAEINDHDRDARAKGASSVLGPTRTAFGSRQDPERTLFALTGLMALVAALSVFLTLIYILLAPRDQLLVVPGEAKPLAHGAPLPTPAPRPRPRP